MIVEWLEKSFGRAVKHTALARYLELDPRTVKKYADQWGGVQIGGQVLFFENRLEEIFNGLQGDKARQGALARLRQKERPQTTKDFHHPKRGCSLGGRTKESGLVEDRHSLLDTDELVE